ncbi:MAG: hypothetical protein KBF34_15740 [Phenylobacterium sp.]|nr:hypothetical protein [Phenylobacterium sp.]
MLIAGTLLLGLPAATVETPAKAAVVRDLGSTPIEDKLICRNEGITGSNFRKKVCLKQSEWLLKGKARRTNSDGVNMQDCGAGGCDIDPKMKGS